jgi:hypothetical protein
MWDITLSLSFFVILSLSFLLSSLASLFCHPEPLFFVVTPSESEGSHAFLTNDKGETFAPGI